jgi:hypothetical protein
MLKASAAEEPAEVTHIAKGAEDVQARGTDEVSARLRSFDLRRHRTRERTLTSGVVAACVITALVFVAALYASMHRSQAPALPLQDVQASDAARVTATAQPLQGAPPGCPTLLARTHAACLTLRHRCSRG